MTAPPAGLVESLDSREAHSDEAPVSAPYDSIENPNERKRWSLGEAQDVVNAIELPLLSLGYAVALRGEVLTTGRGRELGLFLVPLTSRMQPAAALSSLETILKASGVKLAAAHGTHALLNAGGRLIDVMILATLPGI